MVVLCVRDGRVVRAGALLWGGSEFTEKGRKGGRGSETERASERARERVRWLARHSDFF